MVRLAVSPKKHSCKRSCAARLVCRIGQMRVLAFVVGKIHRDVEIDQ